MWNEDLLTKDFLKEDRLEKKATRDGFGDAIAYLGGINSNVVALTADLRGSVRLSKFIEQFPERFFEVGVAEQNLASVATGLALYGKIPFMTSFAAFSPGLNWNQIRMAAISNANIKIASSHYGINIGPDGVSAQMMSDIAITRVIPNMAVLSPGDYFEAYKSTIAAAEHKGPVYIRYTREKFPVVFKDSVEVKIGGSKIIRKGEDLTIFVTGSLLYEAIKATEKLEKEGNNVELINIPSIKPLDEKVIIDSVHKTKKVVTVEEHQINGGLGGAISELLSEKHPAKLIRVGMQDRYGESGNGLELIKKYGMDRDAIYTAAKKLI